MFLKLITWVYLHKASLCFYLCESKIKVDITNFLSRVEKYIFIKSKTPVTKDLKVVDTNVLR